jgi:iron complex outermembrane recepter protein
MINRHLKSIYIIKAFTLGLSSSLVFSLPAIAQETSSGESVEELVVTGSRIKRPDLTSNSPIAIVEAADLKMTNTVNPEEFLRDDPRFVAAIGSNTNNGSDGGATVNLRNLGEERTLVLVDGKRFTPYDYQGFVDLAMIPTALIERVEVVTGGASAVYGSDAIGGVVNFVMKKDFSGVEVDFSKNSSFESDAQRDDLSITFGGNIDEGKGNIVASLTYSKQDALYQGDRKFSEYSLDNLLDPGGSGNHPNGTVVTSVDIPSLGAGSDDPIQFDNSGNLTTDTKLFNFNPYNLLVTPQEKYVATLVGSYKITGNTEFFSRLSFANNRVDSIIAPTGTFFFPYSLNIDNPFLTPQAQAIFAELDSVEEGAAQNDGLVDIAFGRRLTELGTRDSLYENTTLQFVTGLRGVVFEEFDWEVFAQKGHTARAQNFVNDVDYAKSQQGMLAVTDPDTGDIVCQDSSGGCVPVNYFGPDTITPEMAKFIRFNLNENNRTNQLVAGGTITGPMGFTIPSATNPVKFAVGFEHREEDAQNMPDQNYANANSVGFGGSSPVDASLKVQEYFAEIRMPLVEDVSFAKAVVLEAAVRQSDYDNNVVIGQTYTNQFDNTSYKFGGEWAINDAVRFRSLFQHAVRAPNLAEIGLPKTPSTGDLNIDYCAEASALSDPSLVTLCEQTGVPAGRVGAFNSIQAGQTNNYIGGNPNLVPEEADTLTLGFVFTPESIPLTLSLDYYDIEIENVILALAEQNIVDACYLIEKDANGFFCSRIYRSPMSGSLLSGTDTGVDASSVNAGLKHTKGWDLVINYDIDMNQFGSLGLEFNAVKVMQNKQQDASLFPVVDCVGLVGDSCTRPDPELRFIQTTSWKMDKWSVSLRWQYIDELKQDAVVLAGAPAEDYAVVTIPDYSYFDLFASYQVSDVIEVRTGIYNLFDKEPPIVGNEYGGTAENSGNTYPATYDPVGRAGFVGVNLKF